MQIYLSHHGERLEGQHRDMSTQVHERPRPSIETLLGPLIVIGVCKHA